MGAWTTGGLPTPASTSGIGPFLIVGTVLCAVGYSAASLACCTYEMPLVHCQPCPGAESPLKRKGRRLDREEGRVCVCARALDRTSVCSGGGVGPSDELTVEDERRIQKDDPEGCVS